ncbi:hypothetical protein F5878DRAFT_662351 [Lentinula raphanica]|uniref:Uncharacterized protein n=1 Tax=Lentinula raphanica TaxID=153919 RepID=A0AA38UCH2_9AGAR|nr:hypothetical protein F5878DRAFT_662351 [Lentinula raphanica]
MSTHCQGCDQSFPGGAFLQHVRKTRNAACKSFGESLTGIDAVPSKTISILQRLLNRHTAVSPNSTESQPSGLPRLDASRDEQMNDGSDDEEGDVNMVDVGIVDGQMVNGTSDNDSETNGLGLDFEGEEESSEDEGDIILGDELDWEPDVSMGDDSLSPSPNLVFEEGHFDEPLQLPQSRPPPLAIPDDIREPYIIQYPDPRAGAPIAATPVEQSNPWAPFASETDWTVALWAKTRGPSSTALSEFLAINGVAEQLGLSYRSANELFHCLPSYLIQLPVLGVATLSAQSASINTKPSMSKSVRIIPKLQKP